MSAVLEPRAPGPRRLSLSHRGGCGGPASAGGANSVRHVALEAGTSDPSAGIGFRAAPERERVPPPPTLTIVLDSRLLCSHRVHTLGGGNEPHLSA